MLPLERYLYSASENNMGYFPYQSIDYYSRYKALKDYIFENFARWVNAAMREPDAFYTDHGPDHIDAVIKHAGKLTRVEDYKDDFKLINPYEAFILLCSILVHDIGNVYSRQDHEKRPPQVLKSVGEGIFDDRDERNLISQIAKAHGGKFNGTSDTLANDALQEEFTYLGIEVRPKLLAALLKFSDEISEDRRRSPRRRDMRQTTGGSRIYHEYANSISSCEYDKNSRSVRLNFTIDREILLEPINFGSEPIYLMDFIFKRLHKMNLERMYCMRYMTEVVRIREIVAKVEIVEENESGELEILDAVSLIYKDSGYPMENENMSVNFPEWQGTTLSDRFSPREL